MNKLLQKLGYKTYHGKWIVDEIVFDATVLVLMVAGFLLLKMT